MDLIVYGQRKFPVIASQTINGKLFHGFNISTRPDAPMTLWKSDAALKALNPGITGITRAASEKPVVPAIDLAPVSSTTETDNMVDPHKTDELPIVIIPEETKQEFTAHLSLASRLFLEILINHAVDLPIDTLDLVAEARDCLRDAAQELTRLQREAKNSAYEVTIIKAQLAAVTAERDAALKQIAEVQS